MKQVPHIIDTLGGNAQVARYLQVGPSTVGEMKRRHAIPVKYWPRIKEMAQSLDVHGINNDVLVDAHTVYKPEHEK